MPAPEFLEVDGERYEFRKQVYGPPVSVLFRHRANGKDALRLPPLRRFHRRFVQWWVRYARDVRGWPEGDDLTLTMDDARDVFRGVMQTWIGQRAAKIDDDELEVVTRLLDAGGEPLDGEFADRGMAATLMWMKARTQVADLDIDAMDSVVWAMPWPVEERLGYDESFRRLGFLDDELIAVQEDEVATHRDYGSSRYRSQTYDEILSGAGWTAARVEDFAIVLREEEDDVLRASVAGRLARSVPVPWLLQSRDVFGPFLDER